MLNPRYLDIPLLNNMCDNYDIDTTEEVQVVSKSVFDRKVDTAVDKVVKAGRTTATTEEETQSYSRVRRPVKLVNDLYAKLMQDGDVIDYVNAPDSALRRGEPITLEGEFKASPVSEFGSIMAPMLPRLFQQMAAGNQQPEFDPSEMV
ncbi:hypothetical protein ACL02T_34605, partial [Pseudonocardia sp. RS010]|uniref:DUF6414 family protein n=1 Tax=Pseudonocardia sp. RS010 TaxID=3385979 RepID=UPI0039A29A44